MELVFRLLVAAFVILAPSALFLGLWHGLHALRDDHLVDRMHAHTGTTSSPTLSPTAFVPTVGGQSTSEGEFRVDCRVCGTPNPDDVTFCHECLSRISR